MGLSEEVDKKFAKFLVFCRNVLGSDCDQIELLIKKRFTDCSSHFRHSTDMLSLLKSTKQSMIAEPERNMVHLKDFINELKAYKKKRKAKDETGDRVSKLRRTNGYNSEASTDGSISDSDLSKSCTKTSLDDFNSNSNCEISDVKISNESKIDNSGDGKMVEKDVDTKSKINGEKCNINISDKTDNEVKELPLPHISETVSLTEKISTWTPVTSLNNDTDDSDVVMIIEDDDDVKVNGNDSCIIIDSPHTPSNENLLFSMLSLKPKSEILNNANSDGPTSYVKKSGIQNISESEIPKLDIDLPSSSKSSSSKRDKSKTKKVDGKDDSSKDSSSKDDSTKEADGDKKKADKTERHIKRLESLLERLKNKIEELRNEELTLEDMDDDTSSYIYEDKLERKFVTVWNKLCELKGRNRTTGRPAERVFNYAGSRYEEVNKKLERLVNKNKDFPDFHDVKNCIKKVNRKSNLGLSTSQIDSIARESFLDVGNMLQERRHKDFMCTFRCRIQENFSFDRDPALYDAELQRKLDNNRKYGRDKLEEVINKYADKQIYDDEVEEDGDGGGGEVNDQEGGGSSQDDEEEEEEEVEEDIDDVDQFVDATEILAAYTPSRPAISVNPRLAEFHAKMESGTANSGVKPDQEDSVVEISEYSEIDEIVTASETDKDEIIITSGDSKADGKEKGGKIQNLIPNNGKMSTPSEISVDSKSDADSEELRKPGKRITPIAVSAKFVTALSKDDLKTRREEAELNNKQGDPSIVNCDMDKDDKANLKKDQVVQSTSSLDLDSEVCVIDLDSDLTDSQENEKEMGKNLKAAKKTEIHDQTQNDLIILDIGEIDSNNSAMEVTDRASANVDKIKNVADKGNNSVAAKSPGKNSVAISSVQEKENKQNSVGNVPNDINKDSDAITENKAATGAVFSPDSELISGETTLTSSSRHDESITVVSDIDKVQPKSPASDKCDSNEDKSETQNLKSLSGEKTGSKMDIENDIEAKSAETLGKELFTEKKMDAKTANTSDEASNSTSDSMLKETSIVNKSHQNTDEVDDEVQNSEADILPSAVAETTKTETTSDSKAVNNKTKDSVCSKLQDSPIQVDSQNLDVDMSDATDNSQLIDTEEEDVGIESDTDENTNSKKVDQSSTTSSSTRKMLFLRACSEDSQSNDCLVVGHDQPDSVVDQADSECVLIEDETEIECDSSVKTPPKPLKFPPFLNTQNSSSIRNKVTTLFNKAKQNVNNAFKKEMDLDKSFSCSQVSTSSEGSNSQGTPKSPRKTLKHLPTQSLNQASVCVDSFVIEIDEADGGAVMADSDEDICQSTTQDFEMDEVSSSICEPDVIILSDSD